MAITANSITPVGKEGFCRNMGLLKDLTSLDWERLHLGYISEQTLALAHVQNSVQIKRRESHEWPWRPLVVLDNDD